MGEQGYKYRGAREHEEKVSLNYGYIKQEWSSKFDIPYSTDNSSKPSSKTKSKWE